MHLKGHKVGFTAPLYVAILELGDGRPMFRKFLAENDLSCVGLNLKRVKVPTDITLKEINKFFGPIVHENRYIMSSQKTLFLLRRWKGCGWWCTKRFVCQHQG